MIGAGFDTHNVLYIHTSLLSNEAIDNILYERFCDALECANYNFK